MSHQWIRNDMALAEVVPDSPPGGANGADGVPVRAEWDGAFYAAIISELRGAGWLCALLAASTAFYAVGHGAVALAAGLMGRSLAQQTNGAELTGLGGAGVYSILVIAVLATSVKAISGAILAYCESWLAGRVGQRVRGGVVSALLEHGAYDAPPTVLATIAVRIRELESATSRGAVVFVRSVAQLVPLALTLIVVSPLLAAGGLTVLAPFTLVVARLRSKWRAANEHSQALVEQLFGGVDDLVRNVDLWRSYGAGEQISRVIDATSHQAVRAAARVDGAKAALSGANELLAALALLGAVLLAVRLGIPLGDGTLVAFAVVFFMAYRPLRDLGDGRAWCNRGAVAMAGLGQLVRCRALKAGSAAQSNRGPHLGARSTANLIVHSDSIVAGRLRVEALGARHRGPRTSFTVEPGELIAVVGATGSGKTTLLRVLLGLEPATGRVRYSARDITEAPVGPSTRPFAWVPQDAPLVTGTLLSNVSLHAPSEASARTALKQIGAERLLKYQAEVIGPGGRPLSGGERRQVALARALASGAPVLLVDEPTAGLDSHSTVRVLAALQRLRAQRSVIVVTHRQQVAAIADRVVPIGSHS